jgi:hypothetical protein
MKWNQFWQNVEKRPGGCWIWKGPVELDGYGRATYYYKTCYAHTLAAFLMGLVPSPRPDSELQVEQTCGDKLCCSVAHLRVVKKEVRKTQHGNAKLSPAVAKKIRLDRKKGAKLAELSSKYGVSIMTISRIVRKLVY